MLIWVGVLIDHSWRLRKWGVVAILTFFLLRSLVHRAEMLRLPDELHDFRQVIAEVNTSNIHYGATIFSYSHVLTALSEEAVIFAAVDRDAYGPYLRAVKAQPEIVLVYPVYQPPLPDFLQKIIFGNRRQQPQRLSDPGSTIKLWNTIYTAKGEVHICGEVGWRIFRKGSTTEPEKPAS